jgi:S1-C subfamily serine protease
MAVEEVVASCGPSVCIVRGRLGHGSGFVVAPGVVATNYHVVEPNMSGGLQVSFPSSPGGQGRWTPARFIHGSKNRDLAFVSYSGNHRALSLASDYRFRSGQEIIIIGSPGVGNVDLIQNAVTRGLMSTMLTEGDLTLYQLDASVNPGNSGGPVFDDYGQVVGVVTAKARKEERLSFCVSVNTLRDELRRARITVK